MKTFSTFLDSRSLLAGGREPNPSQKVSGFRLPAGRHQGAVLAFTLTFDRSEYNKRGEMAAKGGAEFFPVPIAPG